MDSAIVEKLLTLNRDFYTAFARDFAASRSLSDPALTSILPHIPERARVLDVGCGNGRLALLLDRERPGARYVGIDAVPELIEVAREQARDLEHITAQFHVADITRPNCSLFIDPLFIDPLFIDPLFIDSLFIDSLFIDPLFIDTVVCLAVLHHIPSYDLRLQVVQAMAAALAPGGCVLISTWQFLDSDRMRRKIVDWSEVDVRPETLEPGDYLLDWKRGGRGLRYCHLVDEAEVNRLAAESGLHVRETFRAGGREGNLSLFAVLEASDPSTVSQDQGRV